MTDQAPVPGTRNIPGTRHPALGTSGGAPEKSPARIAGMFDAIAARYDFLNHLLSAGIDRRWRRKAIRSLALSGRERVLDVCTGTGRSGDRGADGAAGSRRASSAWISRGRCSRWGATRSRAGASRRRLRSSAATRRTCPPADASVDAVTIAFGIRNVERPEAACAEMRRVLEPGGRLAILEFAIPTLPIVRQLYLWYFRHVLPLIGRLVSHHNAAYGYLPESVGAFATPDEFVKILRHAGFQNVAATPLTFGIVYLYTARGVVAAVLLYFTLSP